MRSKLLLMLLFLGGTNALAQDRIVHEGVVDARQEEVWRLFTTSEGLRSWLAPRADIELCVGCLMRANYDPAGTLGDDKTIENTILSFDPPRMLSIKATKPPATFPWKEVLKEMWTVIHFEPAECDQTKVTFVSLGFGQSEEAQAMRRFFEKGNAGTLESLRKAAKSKTN